MVSSSSLIREPLLLVRSIEMVSESPPVPNCKDPDATWLPGLHATGPDGVLVGVLVAVLVGVSVAVFVKVGVNVKVLVGPGVKV